MDRRAAATRHATRNGGVIMLSPEDEVLAMVGSVDYNDTSIDGEVNVTLAPRQPGSALKPIVYAAAMQRGWTPATILWDQPVEFPQPDGSVYAPRNYDDSWHGPQRLRMALANSLNIPAIKTIEYVGVENFVEQAHAMGITTLNDTSAYGLALVLGAGEVRLLDLTNVYNTIRNGGLKRDPWPSSRSPTRAARCWRTPTARRAAGAGRPRPADRLSADRYPERQCGTPVYVRPRQCDGAARWPAGRRQDRHQQRMA